MRSVNVNGGIMVTIVAPIHKLLGFKFVIEFSQKIVFRIQFKVVDGSAMCHCSSGVREFVAFYSYMTRDPH